MYEKLGMYYKEQHPGGEKHSRVDRYHFLLDFADKNKKSNQWNYSELLTLDFYLRENAKTRPGFARDLAPYKKEIRRIFSSEKIREILPDYEAYDAKQIERMTHVEVFGIDTEEKAYILFDYKNRNPLNKQARTVDVTELIKESL